MHSLMSPLRKEFTFAGFDFPRYVGTLPRGSLPDRLSRAKNPCCGPYYHAPTPNVADGAWFYLDSDFMLGLRWRWCDDVVSSIGHTGWFCDEYGDNTIRGLVMTLPHGRGFLAGWSMGASMASFVQSRVYDDEDSAAFAADSLAEHVAQHERDAVD
jgi:hypothetical protein